VTQYKIRQMTIDDLPSLSTLQPPGWRDLEEVFTSFLRVRSCRSFVAALDGRVVATGLATVNGTVGWVGMIIVHPDFRNRGIGTRMTREVMDYLTYRRCKTLALTATSMGRPVYEKLGFRVQTENHFYRGVGDDRLERHPNVKVMNTIDLRQCMGLDRRITGEDRTELLLDSFQSGWLVVDPNLDTIQGFCANTTLGSPTVAIDPAAIPVLLDMKRVQAGSGPLQIVVPTENTVAREYLTQNGFEELAVSPRMTLGQNMTWRPSLVIDRFMGAIG
jgi:ribosomal protein S18 acetylase RimI-like enzyme